MEIRPEKFNHCGGTAGCRALYIVVAERAAFRRVYRFDRNPELATTGSNQLHMLGVVNQVPPALRLSVRLRAIQEHGRIIAAQLTEHATIRKDLLP